MDDAWIFTHSDTWTRTDMPDWLPGEGGDDMLVRLGYAACQRAWDFDPERIDFFGAWKLWRAETAVATSQYAIELDLPFDGLTYIWLPTLPDLMAYMRLYGRLGQVEMERLDWHEVSTLLKRLFRAWHGHEADRMCASCDPQGIQARDQERVRLKALAATKQAG